MKVNGEMIPLQSSIPLDEFLKNEGYNLNRIAVEKNGEIVPKDTYSSNMLHNDDTLEIVRFVGGG